MDHSSRYVAAKYANKIFKFNDIESRVICLIGSGDPKLEVREESREALQFPEYIENFAIEVYQDLLPSLTLLGAELYKFFESGMNYQAISGLKYIGPYIIESFSYILEFIRGVMIKSANPEFKVVLGVLHESRCYIEDLETMRALKTYLKASLNEMVTNSMRGIDHYAFFIKEGLTNTQSGMIIIFRFIYS